MCTGGGTAFMRIRMGSIINNDCSLLNHNRPSPDLAAPSNGGIFTSDESKTRSWRGTRERVSVPGKETAVLTHPLKAKVAEAGVIVGPAPYWPVIKALRFLHV
jgi:hypothetical protein